MVIMFLVLLVGFVYLFLVCASLLVYTVVFVSRLSTVWFGCIYDVVELC